MYPTDEAVIKAVYLSLQNANMRPIGPIKNWPIIANQFNLMFGDRINIDRKNIPLYS